MLSQRHSFRLQNICLIAALGGMVITADCTPSPPTIATATPTFAAPLPPTITATSPDITPLSPTPSPAPPPPQVLLVTAGGAQAEVLEQTLQNAARTYGWEARLILADSPTSVQTVAAGNAAIVVVDGPELVNNALLIAPSRPQVYFIGLATEQTVSTTPPNVLLFGMGREDQVGFLAGAIAGLATRSRQVAVVGPADSVAAAKYRYGFLHGVRYTCPKCRVDLVDGGAEEASRHVMYGADIIYSPPGAESAAILQAAAIRGAAVIGSATDGCTTLCAGETASVAEQLLANVSLDLTAALEQALEQYHLGQPPSGLQPLAAANGALHLMPGSNWSSALDELDQAEVTTVWTRLRDGSLETGIDPLTGVEK